MGLERPLMRTLCVVCEPLQASAPDLWVFPHLLLNWQPRKKGVDGVVWWVPESKRLSF